MSLLQFTLVRYPGFLFETDYNELFTRTDVFIMSNVNVYKMEESTRHGGSNEKRYN